jgi:flagellar biosynthetic protein FliQ
VAAPLITDTDILQIATMTVEVALKLSAPILVTALVVGFAISLFQSMTQIQEFTLAFVPKVVAVGIALLLSGNWMLHTMVSFTQQLWGSIPGFLE